MATCGLVAGATRSVEAELVQQGWGCVSLRPEHRLLIIGSRHTANSFLARHAKRKLTLLFGDARYGEDVPALSSVRFEAPIGAGQTSVFRTYGLGALEFTCYTESMIVRPIDEWRSNHSILWTFKLRISPSTTAPAQPEPGVAACPSASAAEARITSLAFSPIM